MSRSRYKSRSGLRPGLWSRSRQVHKTLVKIRQAGTSQSIIPLKVKVKVMVKVKGMVKVKFKVMDFGTHMRFSKNLVKIRQGGASALVMLPSSWSR